MKRTVILSLIITVYTIHVHAQSIYQTKIGNSVNPSFAIVKTSEDNLAKGTGVILSLKSSVDFGLSNN